MEVEEDTEDKVADYNAADDGNPQLEDDPLGYNPQLSNTRYDPELRNDRRENKKKLKRRFEHIFEKYEQDFEGIGDEIDLKTGEIVVDNGHLQRMKNEHDVGNKAPIDPVDPSLQVLADGTIGEVSKTPDINGLSILHQVNDDGDSGDEETSFEDADDGDSSGADDNEDSATSPFDADESAVEDERISAAAIAKPSKSTFTRGRSSSIASSISDAASGSPGCQASPNGDILDQVPGLKDSMLNLQSKYKRGETVDPDAIQALGMSIANQLANFISRPGDDKSRRKSRRSKDSSWSFPVLPEDQSRKRRPRSRSPPLEEIEPPPSGKKSIWAPIRHPRQQKRRRMKNREATQQLELDEDVSLYPPVPEDMPSMPTANQSQAKSVRVCANCESSDSDVWRKGPTGDLCNTCGMYLYRYGLMRPIESAADPITPEDTEGDIDPLERDWFLASAKLNSTTKKEIIKPVGVKNSHFVVEEDALIIQLKEIDLLSWERMATYFPGRSAYALQCRYSKKLHGRAPLARNILLEQGYRGTPDANGIMIFSYTREPFKDEEDELLLKLIDEDGLDFDAVAESLPGRSPEVLEIRYRELVKELLGSRPTDPDKALRQRRASREGSQPLARNARYSADEDAKIIKLREIDKLNWAQVAEKMEGRNSFSLQKRYIRELCGRHPTSIMAPRKAYSHLTLQFGTPGPDGEVSDSSVDLESPKSIDYSAEEDAMLLDLRDAQGLTWEEIDPKMPGRSRSSIKRRYKYLRECSRVRGQADIQNDGEVATGAQYDHARGRTRRDNDNLVVDSQTISRPAKDEQDFTETEDNLIRKLRDLESLPWSEIALQLPGKTVPSISERYYHFLLPGKVNAVQDQSLGSRPPVAMSPVTATPQNGKPSSRRQLNTQKRWTTEEDTLLTTLREQGETWERIARQLPGRTSKAARIRYAAISEPSVKVSQPQETETTLMVGQPPGRLLLPKPTVPDSNRTTRTSSSWAKSAMRAPLQTPATAAQQPHMQPLISEAELPRRADAYRAHLENPAPEDHPQPYPQTPFSQPIAVPQSSELRPVATAFYATPARFNSHGHPYFVKLPATYPLPSPMEGLAPKPPQEKLPAAPAPNAVKQDAHQRIFKRFARNKPQRKPNERRPNKQRRAKAARSDPDVIRHDPVEQIGTGEDKVGDDSSASESDHESWHESQNESESEADQSDNIESEDAQQQLPTCRAKMTVDPASPDDELHVDNSFHEGDTRQLSAAVSDDLGPSRRRSTASPVNETEHTDVQQLQSELAEILVKHSSKFEKGELVDMAYVEAHPEEAFRHRGNGRWVRDPTAGVKPHKREFVDLDYVNAHPEETFHHRGHGRWARGLPLAGESSKFAIHGPEHKKSASRVAKEERFSIAYVDAHPDETFHHRGRGQWARGLPDASEYGKFVVRGPGYHAKSSAQNKEELFDIEYVRAHPDETFHHRGRGRWARGPTHEYNEEQSYSQLDPDGAGDVSMNSLDSDVVDTPETQLNGKDADNNGKLKRPAISNTKLAVMALQSKAPEPIQLPEIYRFVEDTFEYFKHNTAYRAGIRATLSQQPQFQRAGAMYGAGWILAGASETAKVDQAGDVATSHAVLSSSHETHEPSSDEIKVSARPLGSSGLKKTPASRTKERRSNKTAKPPANEQQLDQSSLLEIDSSELSIISNGPARSSPRGLKTKTSPLKPDNQATTPGTGNSTLFSHMQQEGSADTFTPAKIGPLVVKRFGRISDLHSGGRRRVVETPVREINDSEDELA